MGGYCDSDVCHSIVADRETASMAGDEIVNIQSHPPPPPVKYLEIKICRDLYSNSLTVPSPKPAKLPETCYYQNHSDNNHTGANHP